MSRSRAMRMSLVCQSVLLLFSATCCFGDEPAGLLGKLPGNFSVLAVGSSQGTIPVAAQLDETGHKTTQANVVVNQPGSSVVLVLSAYNPVVWHIGRTKDTKIVGVIVGGYHGQAVTGIDKSVPCKISTSMKKGEFPYFYAYEAGKKLLRMNDSIKNLVGREIDHFEFKPTNGVFCLGDLPKESEIIYSEDRKLAELIPEKRVLAGGEALNQLITDKKIRLATKEEIEAWIDVASEKYKRFNPELRVSTYMRVGWTYMVLDKFTLPKGMSGANSRSFIIPLDMPFPSGPLEHNDFYLMDGTVAGTAVHSEE